MAAVPQPHVAAAVNIRAARIALAQAANGVGMAVSMAKFNIEKVRSAVEAVNAIFDDADNKVIWEGAEDEQSFTEWVYTKEEYARLVQALDQLNAAAHDAIHEVAEPLGRLVESCKAAPDDGCEVWLRAANRATMEQVRETINIFDPTDEGGEVSA